jgi:hypothetical protein
MAATRHLLLLLLLLPLGSSRPEPQFVGDLRGESESRAKGAEDRPSRGRLFIVETKDMGRREDGEDMNEGQKYPTSGDYQIDGRVNRAYNPPLGSRANPIGGSRPAPYTQPGPYAPTVNVGWQSYKPDPRLSRPFGDTWVQ